MERVWVGAAAMQGPEHYRRRINRQDQAHFFRMGKWIFASVCDGCSQSRLSEVGAGLFAYAAPQVLYKAVIGGLSFEKAADYFRAEMSKFTHDIVKAFPFGARYLEDFVIAQSGGFPVNMATTENYLAYEILSDLLQATIIAFCIHEEEGGFLLIRGDGHIYIDGELKSFDFNDQPPYQAYDWAVDNYPGPPEDLNFEVVHVPKGFLRVGGTTDGWPWHELIAFPFGHWQYLFFERWLCAENGDRRKKVRPELSPEQGWLLYHPEDVGNLARKICKNPVIEEAGSRRTLATDDLSGVFIEREIIQEKEV